MKVLRGLSALLITIVVLLAPCLARTDEPVHAPGRYRFRNISGRAGGWKDERGRITEAVSQRNLAAIAAEMGESYVPGAWIEVSLAQVGLDERQLIPWNDPNGDVIVGEIID